MSRQTHCEHSKTRTKKIKMQIPSLNKTIDEALIRFSVLVTFHTDVLRHAATNHALSRSQNIYLNLNYYIALKHYVAIQRVHRPIKQPNNSTDCAAAATMQEMTPHHARKNEKRANDDWKKNVKEERNERNHRRSPVTRSFFVGGGGGVVVFSSFSLFVTHCLRRLLLTAAPSHCIAWIFISFE